VWKRIGLFNLVGFAGFLLQLGTLTVLTRVFGWHYAIASAVAIELAILHNFLGHSRLTWADRRPSGARAWAARLVRDQAVKSLILAMNLTVTVVLVANTAIAAEVASVCAVGVCSVFGYLASDRLVFMERLSGSAGT
jgi:putative flippase GtrA